MGEIRYGLYNKPYLALLVLVLVYVGTEVVSEVLAQLVGVSGSAWKHTAIKVACFSLMTFVFVPFVLALPNGERSLLRFLRSVGLARATPWGPLTILTALSYLVFVLSQLAGSVLYHLQLNERFVLDFSRHSLLDARSITSGVFEEVILRGVVLAVLVRRYSARRSIVVAAAIFAGLHLLNALNPSAQLLWVLAQATWAFAFGVLYGLLFVKTGSLYPSIVLHYLGNAMVGVWFRGLDCQGLVAALYGLPFYGVLPAVTCILLVHRLTKRGYLRQVTACAVVLTAGAVPAIAANSPCGETNLVVSLHRRWATESSTEVATAMHPRPGGSSELMSAHSASVPMGPGILIDGSLLADEWDCAESWRMTGGGQILLMHDGQNLYLGVRTAGLGWVHVAAETGPRVLVLHASAALGTFEYQSKDGTWWLERHSGWAMRNIDQSEETRLARKKHLREHGWVASTAWMGRPEEREFAIQLQVFNGAPQRIAVFFATDERTPEYSRWPGPLDDSVTDRELMSGVAPPRAEFAPETWCVLTLGTRSANCDEDSAQMRCPTPEKIGRAGCVPAGSDSAKSSH